MWWVLYISRWFAIGFIVFWSNVLVVYINLSLCLCIHDFIQEFRSYSWAKRYLSADRFVREKQNKKRREAMDEGLLSTSDKQSMVSFFLEIAVGQTADTAIQFLQVTYILYLILISDFFDNKVYIFGPEGLNTLLGFFFFFLRKFGLRLYCVFWILG